MRRLTFRGQVLKFTVVAIVAMGMSAPQAEARWGSSGGSWGSGGGSWGSSGGSWGSSGGSWGSRGGGFFAKHKRPKSWGSSGGSWGSSGGSWGSSGGSWGSHGSSGGSWASYGGGQSYDGGWASNGSAVGGAIVRSQAAPATIVRSRVTPRTTVDRASATLLVDVPADAKVFVNGKATRTPGTSRRYVSHGLERNRTYSYVVRAEFTRNGQNVSETKRVRLTTGGQASVAFTAAEPAEQIAKEPVTTTLAVHVPLGAKVFLSDRETKMTGELREFTTGRLKAGQTWPDYNVRVVLDRDGKSVVRERQLTLVGGTRQELTFDFDTPPADATLAAARR